MDGMRRLGEAVLRLKDGEWLCRAPVTPLVSGNGSHTIELTPGVVYRKGVRHYGLDVAAMLDDWLATGTLPSHLSIRVNGQPV